MNKVLEISNWNHFRPSTGAYNWTYISIMTYISWTLTITHKTCVSCNLLFPYLDLCSQLRKNLLEFPGNVSHIYTGVQPSLLLLILRSRYVGTQDKSVSIPGLYTYQCYKITQPSRHPKRNQKCPVFQKCLAHLVFPLKFSQLFVAVLFVNTTLYKY